MDPDGKTTQTSTVPSPLINTFDSPAPQRLPHTLHSASEEAFSQPTPSTVMNFLNLPSKARNEIYKRMLVVAHPLYLFQDMDSRVEIFAPDRPRRWLTLLHTNRQVSREASAVLYGMNNFTLLDETRLLQNFLNSIGAVNASSLSHLSISFPVIDGRPGIFSLREDSLQSLKLLQERCTNLKTLETFISSKNSSGLTKVDQESSQFTREALSQFDRQLKAIPSLEKVVVRVFNGVPTSVMESMTDFGWIVLPANRNQ